MLLLLAPVISEVLFGTTRLTTLFVLIPQIGAWGCGALIIRELVRRRGRGWLAVLLLGLALATAEECVIQQTSVAPLVGVDPNNVYGRMWGVNWVYFLWALAYESIWAVILPIQLTELAFSARRGEPWLRTRGLAIAAATFLLASVVAWYSWTQIFVPQFFPESAYQVPSVAIGIAILTILLLAVAALGPWPLSPPQRQAIRPAPQPWLAGLISFLLGLSWFVLVFLAYGAVPTLPAAVPLVVGLAAAGIAFFAVTRWSSSPEWQDAHRLALVFGAILASMLAGFAVMRAGGALLIDVVGKAVFNVAAILLLVRLASLVHRRRRESLIAEELP